MCWYIEENTIPLPKEERVVIVGTLYWPKIYCHVGHCVREEEKDGNGALENRDRRAPVYTTKVSKSQATRSAWEGGRYASRTS